MLTTQSPFTHVHCTHFTKSFISLSLSLSFFSNFNSQVQSKASTISSGARAAAQTLNVPIERLEAQVHSSSSGKPSPTNPNQIEKSHRHHNDEIIPDRIEHNGKSHVQSHAYQQEHLSKTQHHGGLAGFWHSNGIQMESNGIQMDPNGIQIDTNGTQMDPNSGQMMHRIMSSSRSHPVASGHHQDENEEHASSLTASPANMKYSLLQFAMQHFRDE